MLTLTEPMSSGFGGGCFIMIRWANGTVTAIDGREEAPSATGSVVPRSTGGTISIVLNTTNL
jgi:gamma-glutamyltranspeptidase